jgi:hypothetical protein
MNLFKNQNPEEPETVEFDGTNLRCLVCSHDKFWHRRAQLNTSLATFFELDWANPSADCYICDRCGYVHWFFPKN